MKSFQQWLGEGARDEELRREAMSIADRFLAFIDSSTNLYGRGLLYDFPTRSFKLGEIIPEHPDLKLRFINQPKFGKNDSLGTQRGNSIAVALHARTLTTAIRKGSTNVNDPKYNDNHMAINGNVAKFLRKPENYDTLVHEIMHYLDQKRIGKKVFSNYPYDDQGSKRYFNHPAEYNAFLQAFLIRQTKAGKTANWQEILTTLAKEDWFAELEPDLRRRAIQRAYQWFVVQNKINAQGIDTA